MTQRPHPRFDYGQRWLATPEACDGCARVLPVVLVPYVTEPGHTRSGSHLYCEACYRERHEGEAPPEPGEVLYGLLWRD